MQFEDTHEMQFSRIDDDAMGSDALGTTIKALIEFNRLDEALTMYKAQLPKG